MSACGPSGVRLATSQCWLGAVAIACSAEGLRAVLLGDHAGLLLDELHRRFPTVDPASTHDAATIDAVHAAIAEPGTRFDLPIAPVGTAFQRRVWQALLQIPAGSTASYQSLAAAISHPGSARAVAAACAANSLAVVIPCHRVVRSDGALAGYRWGIERKRRLLERERIV